jgi:hypothetical protein
MGGINFNTGGVSSFDPANPGPIGAGTPSTGAFTRLSVAQGTLTDPVTGLNLTATWNDAADTFRGLEFVVTDTASAAGSTPIRVMGGAAGTTQLFGLSKSGGLSVPLLGVAGFSPGGGGYDFGCVNGRFTGQIQSDGPILFGVSAFLNLVGASNTLRLGANHPTTPTLQTIKAHDVTTGTGADLLLSGGTGSVANGMVRIGAHSAIGAETVTGFIEIKDAGGTIRKLAVVS